MNAYRSAPIPAPPCAACAERAKLRPPLALAKSMVCPICGHLMIAESYSDGQPKRLSGDVWACSGRTWFARMRGCPKVAHVHRRCATCGGEWRELPASEVSK